MLFSPVWLNRLAVFTLHHLQETDPGLSLDAAILPFTYKFASLKWTFFPHCQGFSSAPVWASVMTNFSW